MKILKKILVFILAIAAFSGVFYLAYKFDLQINQFLYSPKNMFALFAEVVGWWPLYLCIPMLGWVFTAFSKRTAIIGAKKIGLGIAGIFLIIAGGIALFQPACKYLANRGYTVFSGNAFWVLTTIAAIAIVLWGIFTKLESKIVFKLGGFAVFLTVYMAVHNIIINVMKGIWNRTRFDTMLSASEGFGKFSEWLFVGNGGTSFPSGHTGAAATAILLVFLCKLFTQCKREEKNFLFIGYVFAIAVGVGRIIIGRHYLSDITMSIFVVTVTVAILWYLPPIKKYFSKVVERSEKL